jgi:hypothetical protein
MWAVAIKHSSPFVHVENNRVDATPLRSVSIYGAHFAIMKNASS